LEENDECEEAGKYKYALDVSSRLDFDSLFTWPFY
jgi:hypothetical protein